MKTNIKIIATSLALVSSVSAWAGMGGLSVQSHLGQPFSGSIVVTGDEAEALKSNRRVIVSGSGIRGTVIPQGNGNVVVRLRSSSPIREPMINFTVSAGRQSREYTAMLDPSNYVPTPAPRHVEKPVKEKPRKVQQPKAETPKAEPKSNTSGSLKAGERDFIERNGRVAAHQEPAPVESRPTRATTTETTDNSSSENTRRNTARETRESRETRERNNNRVPVTTGAVNTVRQSGKAPVSTRRHRAQAGETLSRIAERYRPRNMSPQMATRALAIANPGVFKRGHTIQRPVTLYIPTASQWHAYAQRAQTASAARRTHVAPANTGGYANNTNVNSDVHTPINNPNVAAPVDNPSTQPAPQPQPQPQNNNTTNTTAKATSNTTPIVNTPPTPIVPASVPVHGNTQPASKTAIPPSLPADASTVSIQAASPALASAASAPSIPVAPVQPAVDNELNKPVQEDIAIDDDEEIDWALYGGGIGTTFLAATVAAYFLRKRRSQDVESEDKDSNKNHAEEDDDDDVQWEEEKSPKSSIAARLKPAATTAPASVMDDDTDDDSDDFETVDDDDDDVIFTNTPPATTSVAAPAFNLNDFEPDAATLKEDLVATTAAANIDDDDWGWNDSKQPENTTNHHDDGDWSLDDGTTEPVPTEYSLDALENEIAKTDFNEFGQELENISLSSPRSTIAEVNDIDTMFADVLNELDSDIPATTSASFLLENDDELAMFERPKPKPVAEELDDIDALFANKLADLDALENQAASTNDDVLFAEEDDELNQLLNKSLADVSAPAHPHSEVDDIDALFAQKLGNNTSAAQAPAHDPVNTELDDIDALFADKLDSLNELNTLDSLDNLMADDMAVELDMLNTNTASNPMTELDEIDALFANKLNQFDVDVNVDDMAPNTTTEVAINEVEDILADEFADLDALNALNELNDLNNLSHDDLVSANELNSLNSLSEFDELSTFASTSPAPSNQVDDIDKFFANALSDIDTPLSNVSEPVIKPILSEEDIENLNSLSELDNLESNEPNMDTLFANVLDDLDTLSSSSPSPLDLDSSLDSLGSLETNDLDLGLDFDTAAAPLLDADSLNDTMAIDSISDVDALSFDLSDFDALQNSASSTEAAEDMAINDVNQLDDALSFDLSGFDAFAAETPAEESVSTLDDVDMLAFATPEIPDVPLETPELSTPAVDFELPEATSTIGNFAELETADNFADFDLPIGGEDAGFVSGAIGSGDTLTAKLDLAKMYIEVEDTNAARATLQELLAEADGDIAQQAQALMEQIG